MPAISTPNASLYIKDFIVISIEDIDVSLTPPVIHGGVSLLRMTPMC